LPEEVHATWFETESSPPLPLIREGCDVLTLSVATAAARTRHPIETAHEVPAPWWRERCRNA